MSLAPTAKGGRLWRMLLRSQWNLVWAIREEKIWGSNPAGSIRPAVQSILRFTIALSDAEISLKKNERALKNESPICGNRAPSGSGSEAAIGMLSPSQAVGTLPIVAASRNGRC